MKPRLVAGAFRAGRVVRYRCRSLRFYGWVPGCRVAADRRGAGDHLRIHRVLWVHRCKDRGCGPPGYGPPGRMAQAGRRDMARDHRTAGLVRGRRSAGRVLRPPRVPGWCRVASPAAAGRGVAGIRGRQGCRRSGLVWHGGLGAFRRGPHLHYPRSQSHKEEQPSVRAYQVPALLKRPGGYQAMAAVIPAAQWDGTSTFWRWRIRS